MTDNKKINIDFLDNGYSIPYPEDPFEMNSGPFYVGEGNNGETIVSLEVTRTQCNSGLVASWRFTDDAGRSCRLPRSYKES